MILRWTIAVLVGVIAVASAELDADWWKNGLFYQIYPRSFKDSNGDGTGDIKGIISKLYHLKESGVTATWLSPIFQSPGKDHGYDISDFRTIDPLFGTMEDVEELIEEAHKLEIKIIMDFVPNHSSHEHEWFKQSEDPTADDHDKYKDYYVWVDDKSKEKPGTEPPNNWISVFKGSAWTYSPKRKQWYLHQFTEWQPDLNYRNAALVKDMKDVLTFWLDKGVDGFRVDAVGALFEDKKLTDEPPSYDPSAKPGDYESLKHIYTNDLDETYDMVYQWREHVDEYSRKKGDHARVLMTEAYTDINRTMYYYGNGIKEGAHFAFNFQLITKVDIDSTARHLALTVKEWLTYMPLEKTANWVIGNHDRHRVATRFGPQRVDGMNMMASLLPGVMVTYQGEEIGLEDGEVSFDECQDPSVCDKSEEEFYRLGRDFARTPFHWDTSTSAGFSTNKTTWLPVSEKYKETNLAKQKVARANSHYHIYQQLVELRKEKAFTEGTCNVFPISDNVLAFTREAVNKASYVVVINTANKTETADLSPFSVMTRKVDVVVSSVKSTKRNGVFLANNLKLEPYESLVARVLPDLEEGSQDWWKDALFYQIYPRSFKDSDGDGVGDLKGIISKLEHLKNIGVTATWLSPIYKSPQVDAGYDISDYRDIHEEYGTLEDFEELVEKAHALGIKIVMDFVPNHSSDEHEWFLKSMKKEPGYEDYYVWKDANKTTCNEPNNWKSLFKDSAWTFKENRQQYYLHQFASAQPDLNYRNGDVVEEMKDVLKFWLDKNVDGFRMDAVPFIFEDDKFEDEPLSGNADVKPNEHGYLNHIYTSDQNGTFDMIYQWRKFLDKYSKERGGDVRVMMTEAYTDIDNTMRYYGNETDEGAQFTFNFQFVTKLNMDSTAEDTVNVIKEWFNYMPQKYTSNWVIGNHDNSRVATRFGPERVDGMNMLVALLPGIMVTYNGEEIGQENGEVTWEQGQDPSACNGPEADFEKTSRDFARTPFHWDETKNAGFSTGNKTWLPVSEKYTETNLKKQRKAGDRTHYQIYQNLVNLRKEKAFAEGSFAIKAFSPRNVLAFTRTVEDGPSFVVVLNIGNLEARVDLTSFEAVEHKIDVVATNMKSKKLHKVFSGKEFTLEPYESVVARIIPYQSQSSKDWWKTAVFYQIYPRSFKDQNNDGNGDLKGITSNLDHLKDVGVTAVWLSPIYKSPQVDGGYDISDFFDIDGIYGTLKDFDELVQKAHELGLKVVLDFVPNHSSNQHPWFEKSEKKEDNYDDFYIWKKGTGKTPPNNWLSRFKYSAWKYSDERKEFYLHQFADAQPDLNYRNTIVVDKMKEVLKFWMDRGVDGFRMDAVNFMFEDESFADEPKSNIEGVPEDDWEYLDHTLTLDQHDTYDMIYQWRAFLEEYSEEHGGDARVMMTEAYTTLDKTVLYYGNGSRDGAHFTFNFELITNLDKNSNAKDIVNVIDTWLEALPTKYTTNWVLGNHDNKRVATRLGPEKADGFNMLIALLPGVMVTYQGEEIAQEDGEVTWEQGQDPSACNGPEEDFDKISRDFARTPYHWDDSVNAGFNEGHEPWLPVSQKYKQNNLKAQKEASESHYKIYQTLMELRKEKTLISGELTIKAINDNVVGYVRIYQPNSVYVVLFNVGSTSQTVDVSNTFRELTERLEVVLKSSGSQKEIGAFVSSDEINLNAYESIIARTIEDSTTTTAQEATTQGAGSIGVTVLLLVAGCLVSRM